MSSSLGLGVRSRHRNWSPSSVQVKGGAQDHGPARLGWAGRREAEGSPAGMGGVQVRTKVQEPTAALLGVASVHEDIEGTVISKMP